MLAVGAAVVVGVAHKNAPAQGGAGGDDHALTVIVAVQVGVDARHMAVLHVQGDDLGLVDVQVGGEFQGVLHIHVIAFAVGLDAQAVDGGAFAPVEHPALEEGGVGGNAHEPAQGVDLPHQMALCGAADGGIAGHVADEVQCQGKDGGPCAQDGGRMGGLDPCMARAHDDDVVTAKMIDQNGSVLSEFFIVW